MNPFDLTTAEILSIGSEVVCGDVVNTNASYLSASLASCGINVTHHTALQDTPDTIIEAFLLAEKRSRLVVITGGLGPTDDDLTIDTLAKAFNTTLVEDLQSKKTLEAYFAMLNRTMAPNNYSQIMRPEGSEHLPNTVGTAPGLYWLRPETLFIALPGVPREMKHLWQEVVLPKLKDGFGCEPRQTVAFLRFAGIGESDLMAQIKPVLENLPEGVAVAPYVNEADVRLRVLVDTQKQPFIQSFDQVKKAILEIVSPYYYGQTEDTLEGTIGQKLRTAKKKIAVAESCTGGLISSRLTDVSGSSDYITLNAVTYSNLAKQDILNVSPELIAQFGAVSQEVAEAMAEGIRKKAGSHLGLAITGIAGPTGGSDEKPVGLCFIALSQEGQAPKVLRYNCNPLFDRSTIKRWFTQAALSFLMRQL
jgi:nicotinamide-nucleotide amidase